MFNGWSYPLTNIPAGWNSNSKWKLTYSSCQKLLGKDRIYEIGDPTKTQRGDILSIPSTAVRLKESNTPMSQLQPAIIPVPLAAAIFVVTL